jgi:hypothetical protein
MPEAPSMYLIVVYRPLHGEKLGLKIQLKMAGLRIF